MADGQTIENFCRGVDNYTDWVSALRRARLGFAGEEITRKHYRRLMTWAKGPNGYTFWLRHHYGEAEVAA